MACIGNAPAIGFVLFPGCTTPPHSRYNPKAITGPKMNDLIVVEKLPGWQRLKALVLDSVSSPITRCIRNPTFCSIDGKLRREYKRIVAAGLYN